MKRSNFDKSIELLKGAAKPASKTLAPAYEALKWKWGVNKRVPVAAEIEQTILRLIGTLGEWYDDQPDLSEYVTETGGIRVGVIYNEDGDLQCDVAFQWGATCYDVNEEDCVESFQKSLKEE